MARRHAQRALALAKEMGSQYWINQVTGVLAEAYLQQGEIDLCREALAGILDAETPMDSHAKRYCWLRRAELALAEEQPQTALQIIERLIAATPDVEGAVFPTVWMVHARALLALGRSQEAEAILLQALDATRAGHAHLWRVYAALAQLYVVTGDGAKAAEMAVDGRDVVERLAAAVADEVVRENFRERALARLSPHPS